MASLENERKIINCEELFEENHSDFEIYMDAISKLKKRAEEKALKDVGNLSKKRISELESKCMEQKLKLKNCMPSGVIFHVVLYACALTCNVVLFITQILGDYKLIDYYIILMLSVIFSGLLHTSIASLKKWKKFISMDEEEQRNE